MSNNCKPFHRVCARQEGVKRIFTINRLKERFRIPRVQTVLVLSLVMLVRPTAIQQTSSVEDILAEMTPQERVGQLFLVTYYGTDLSDESDIAALITEYHVGGVVLLRENDNFSDQDDLIASTQQTIIELQTLNLPESGPFPALTGVQSFVPLFIGIDYQPGSHVNQQLLTGLTPLPSSMSVGATWNEDRADQVGRVVGAELAALGFNLLLGPSVDVVADPIESLGGSHGNSVYGGDPFWVSEMGTSYVQGLHIGSEDRLTVVVRHFPGFGSANRIPTEEVPSVRRDFSQLASTDLPPFMAVLGETPAPNSITDGIMTAHIRYAGLQSGSAPQQSRPIGLDSQALPPLLGLETISDWREAGGILVSDSLGAGGVALLYDASGTTFANRQIAQNAFSAGNDLLYTRDFGLNPRVDQTENIIDTIDSFVQQYEDNDAFREQVDASVRRILTQKLEVYGEFSSQLVLSEDPPDMPERQIDLTRSIAQESVTLLTPPQPDVPEPTERIVIFTDVRPIAQCADCIERSTIDIDALQSSILRLYGPQSVDIVRFTDVQSFSFAELETFLNDEAIVGPQAVPEEGNEEDPDPVSIALTSADWVVFVTLDPLPSATQPSVVSRFLAQRSLADEQQVVVMAMGAPYYLDSTEANKLTSLIALYSHSVPFIDVAARALFQDVAYAGAAPIAVPSMNYALSEALMPSSDQTITLLLTIERGETGQLVTDIRVEQGDTLRVRTGQILDQNGNPVPDGTPVEFAIDYVNDTVRDVVIGEVVNGSAEVEYLIERPGDLVITASAGSAVTSETIRIVGGIPETPVPPTPVPVATPVPEDSVESEEATADSAERPIADVNFSDLFFTLLGLVAISLTIFFVGNNQHGLNYGLLLALPAFVFGLIAYNYYVLLLPGAGLWNTFFGDGWSASLAAWLGAGLGLLCVLAVIDLRDRNAPQRD